MPLWFESIGGFTSPARVEPFSCATTVSMPRRSGTCSDITIPQNEPKLYGAARLVAPPYPRLRASFRCSQQRRAAGTKGRGRLRSLTTLSTGRSSEAESCSRGAQSRARGDSPGFGRPGSGSLGFTLALPGDRAPPKAFCGERRLGAQSEPGIMPNHAALPPRTMASSACRIHFL